MAGYSGTPLPRKLGIKDGAAIALVGAPPGFVAALGELPPGASLAGAAGGPADVIVCFCTSPGAVEVAFRDLKPRLAWTGGLWLAWQKQRPGSAAALNENTIRDVGLAAGLVDNKVCAIDEEWSGLRFVWRREDRPKPATTAAGAGG